MLCMKHRYKDDHVCPVSKVVKVMEKIEHRKVEQILSRSVRSDPIRKNVD